jgi:hypothetical protein
MSNAKALLRAIRGPILLITLGTLFAVDYYGPYSFTRTWPVLLIVYGVLRLLERTAQNGDSSAELHPGGAQ